MKGVILDSVALGKDAHSVSVSTDYGVLHGLWNGGVPRQKSEVYFELEFNPETDFEIKFKEEFASFSPVFGNVVLVGKVEAWSGGVLDLRIGPALVQVEAPDAPQCGKWLAVRGRDLVLFETAF
jgi:hypothetical protein